MNHPTSAEANKSTLTLEENQDLHTATYENIKGNSTKIEFNLSKTDSLS